MTFLFTNISYYEQQKIPYLQRIYGKKEDGSYITNNYDGFRETPFSEDGNTYFVTHDRKIVCLYTDYSMDNYPQADWSYETADWRIVEMTKEEFIKKMTEIKDFLRPDLRDLIK